MLFLMLISLYTSRVILNALGVEDFGIYNVVGGVVSMFSLISASLTASISRFITYELGTGLKENLNKVFSSSVTIQIGLSIILLILAETIGLWFVNYKLVIPEARMNAANWCYQLSVFSFIIGLISIPYNAVIIAHEKMSAFAYISILEAVGKLTVAWLLLVNPIDRLIFYAILIVLIAFAVRLMYTWYCKKHFDECAYRFVYDKSLFKKMFGFAGWNFFGAGSWILMTQGVNILMNLYFGVAINAARGIAVQVDSAVQKFVSSFTTAIEPQITKSYAVGLHDEMFSLMCRGAKFSFFLMLIMAAPILCETGQILTLWIKIYPDYTVSFVRLAIVVSMIHLLSSTMVTGILATGDIKKYQIIIGNLGMLVLPLSWVTFHYGFSPNMAYVVNIIIFVIQLLYRLKLLKEKINFNSLYFVKEVLIRVFVVSILSLFLPILICSEIDETISRLILVISTCIITTLLSILYVGLSQNERSFVFAQIKKRLIR